MTKIIRAQRTLLEVLKLSIPMAQNTKHAVVYRVIVRKKSVLSTTSDPSSVSGSKLYS